MVVKAFAWSHSAVQTYEQCPHKYYRLKWCDKKHPDRVNDVFGEAAKEGIRVHEVLEARIKSKTPLVGKDAQYESLCQLVERGTADAVLAAEAKFNLNQKFEPCDFFAPWGMAWNDPNQTWLRGALDVVAIKDGVAIIFDWKTGKVKDDMDQLKIFALLVFAHYPEVHTVHAAYVWLKTQEMLPKGGVTFKREESPSLWREQMNRLTPIINSINTNTWIGKPGYLCQKYCPVSEAGTCPYFTRK